MGAFTLIAYIDESMKGEILSTGMFIAKGAGSVIRDALRRIYNHYLRKYGLNSYQGELKFNFFLMMFKKKGHVISRVDLGSMFLDFLNIIRNVGVARSIIVEDSNTICELNNSLCKFLRRRKIRNSTITKFLLIYSALECLEVKEIVFDGGMQISLRELKRIKQLLDWDVEFSVRSSIATSGLEIADFIAGISPYLSAWNIMEIRYGKSRIIKILGEG